MILRPLRPSDRGAFVAAWAASLDLYRRWLPRVTLDEDLEARFELELHTARTGAEQQSHLRLCGFTASGEIAGFFNLNDIVRGAFHNAFVGYSGNVSLARQGYVTEGLRALVDTAFGPLGLHRVQANIIPANRASLAVAARVGFRHEGTARRYLRIGGVWQDHEMFALTSEEWPPPRTAR